jgi:hypothetical protein
MTVIRTEINEVDDKSIIKVNEIKSSYISKINKIVKGLTKLAKRKRRSKLVKLEVKRGIVQQIPLKCRRSLGNILKIYISISSNI